VCGQHHAPAAFTPGEDPVPNVQEARWAPEPVWIGAENLAPPGFDPRTLQPVASRFTDYAIPAPTEMSTRCISWGKGGRCVRLTTLPPSCAFVMKSGNLNSWNPLGHSRPVTGLLLLLLLSNNIQICNQLSSSRMETYFRFQQRNGVITYLQIMHILYTPLGLNAFQCITDSSTYAQ
jgi:hypothetical protein